MIQLARVLIAACTLAACASVNYEPPTSGDRARVRFAVVEGFRAALPSSTANVFHYEDADCTGQRDWMYLINGLYARPDPRSLDMPLWEYHRNGAKEFYVTSGVTHHFIIATNAFTGGNAYATYGAICGVPVFTSFETGRDYELLFQLQDPRTCIVTMNEIVTDSAGPRRVTLQVYTNAAIPSAGCAQAFSRLFQ